MKCLDFTRSIDGRCIVMRINETNSNLEWKYKSDDDTKWKPLICMNDLGTKDYTSLENLPTIDGVQLLGNVELDDLGLIRGWVGTIEEYEHDKDFLPSDTVCHITNDTQPDDMLLNAFDIEFDNTDTGLESRNLHDLILELNSKIDALSE